MSEIPMYPDEIEDAPLSDPVRERLQRIGQTTGLLHEAAELAHKAGLSLDEATYLFGIQYKNAEPVAGCSCGLIWTRADLSDNPNAADEHKCWRTQ
jgi:hypothetical protein